MRNKIVCDTCDENITFWRSIYKDTFHVREMTSPVSEQNYDFCCVNCLLSFFEEMKKVAGTGEPDKGLGR